MKKSAQNYRSSKLEQCMSMLEHCLSLLQDYQEEEMGEPDEMMDHDSGPKEKGIAILIGKKGGSK